MFSGAKAAIVIVGRENPGAESIVSDQGRKVGLIKGWPDAGADVNKQISGVGPEGPLHHLDCRPDDPKFAAPLS